LLNFRAEPGLRGEKGEPGNFEHFLFLLADLRFDILALQDKVFIGDIDIFFLACFLSHPIIQDKEYKKKFEMPLQ
jgi:hypothetical protein